MSEENYKQILNRIKTFIFDVDGVFTNSDIHITENGEMLRVMNAKDGYAVHHALKKGYRIVIITGGNSKGVDLRFKYLGVKDVFSAVKDKVSVLNEYFRSNELNKNEALYMGDDMPDYDVMQEVALPCCPADASPEIKSISKYISSKKGGKGAVRDIIEQVMKLHETWT